MHAIDCYLTRVSIQGNAELYIRKVLSITTKSTALTDLVGGCTFNGKGVGPNIHHFRTFPPSFSLQCIFLFLPNNKFL